MRRLLSTICLLVLGPALSATGCGGGSEEDRKPGFTTAGLDPGQICGNLAADECERIYVDCRATPQQLSALGLPATKLECIGNAMEAFRCSSATSAQICALSPGFDAAQASACSAQVKAADCNKVTTAMVASYAPECGQCGLR